MTMQSKPGMPLAVYILALGIFAMINCELQVLGMMPLMAEDLDASISQIGYLVSFYAAAMALGGPLLTLALASQPAKTTLYWLYAVFVLGEVLGATANNYGVLVLSRLITGAVSGAFFGIALAACRRLVAAELGIQAVAIVLAGIMVGTIVGLPLASWVGEAYGWRASFWLVVLLALLAALGTAIWLPALSAAPRMSVRQELQSFYSRQLWAVFATSFCVIGAVYAAFSYFVPILTQLAGLSQHSVTWLLFAYGVAMLLGNHTVARLAGRGNLRILAAGLLLQGAFQALLAWQAHQLWLAVLAVLGLGLTGISMNPAMVSRVMQVPNGERPLVNTVHASVITLGIMFGSYASGQALEWGYGLQAPMAVGITLALLGLLSLLLDRSPRLQPQCGLNAASSQP
ncbi:MFS transporter [Bacterioplanes sanyensis]|uniref:MFS transporter n=1 Tax=Bacterioplanes sanyensis TaxID=1249553 RepID=A0A222FF49_9GAMM|nr:MFS transporter [Bacterioplanes sanyensis]ASP37379.1 MFS transporter [Bacterioplanes sanyensis]